MWDLKTCPAGTASFFSPHEMPNDFLIVCTLAWWCCIAALTWDGGEKAWWIRFDDGPQTYEQQKIDERGVQPQEQLKTCGAATGLTMFRGAGVTTSHAWPEKLCWPPEPSCKKRSDSAKLSQFQQCSSGLVRSSSRIIMHEASC